MANKNKNKDIIGIQCNPYMGYSPDVVIWKTREGWRKCGYDLKFHEHPDTSWYGDERYCNHQVAKIQRKLIPVKLGGKVYDSGIFAMLSIREAMKDYDFGDDISLKHDFIEAFIDLFTKKFGDDVDNPIIKLTCVEITDPVKRKGLKAVYKDNMAHTINYDEVIDVFYDDDDCDDKPSSKYNITMLEEDEPTTAVIAPKPKPIQKVPAPPIIQNITTPPDKSKCYIRHCDRVRYRFSETLFQYLGNPKKVNIHISPCGNYMEIRTLKIGCNQYSLDVFKSNTSGTVSSHKIFNTIEKMNSARLYICDYGINMVKFDISALVAKPATQLVLELQDESPAPKKDTKVSKEPTWRDIGRSIKSKFRSIFS